MIHLLEQGETYLQVYVDKLFINNLHTLKTLYE